MLNLENLSSIDFEELCRDLAGAEHGCRFTAFGPGPDGGIDGRHSAGDGAIILQCKHYAGSTFSKLKSALKAEVKNVCALKPKRYLFFTSQSLTPAKATELASILDEYLLSPDDIWGRQDIEAALKRNPEIVKAHIKLWLTNTAVLERVLHSGLEAFTQATKDEIRDELRVYVTNPSLTEAAKKLEEEKVLIISGAPGVGKTTLAKMITYQYLNNGWRFYAINSLDEGFAKVEDSRPTIFFFDDFLGRIELDKQSLLQRDTALATFVKRIRRSKNARFVLTTRAHIFEEARRISDHVDDRRLQLSKYLLDVGKYTRRIRSYILFNHLTASELTEMHFNALLHDDWLKKIVDHRNYNPRVIASVSSELIGDVEPDEYPGHIYRALQDPDLIWSKPHRALSISAKNLLVALYFGGPFGQDIDELRINFLAMHHTVCSHYGHTATPDDFEETLRSLESGFIVISGKQVDFVNPSLSDYMKSYLTEHNFLALLPSGVRRAEWAQNYWSHVKAQFKARPEILRQLANAFVEYLPRIEATPTEKHEVRNGTRYTTRDDISMTDRVYLLLDWWEATAQDMFLQRAFDLLTSGALELRAWADGRDLPGLHWRVYNFVPSDHPLYEGLLLHIEKHLLQIIRGYPPTDELVSIIEAVNEHMASMDITELDAAIDRAVRFELEETADAISHLDSEDSLSEQSEHVDQLAALTGRSPEKAKKVIAERIGEIEQRDYSAHQPSLSSRSYGSEDRFSDAELKSLFSSLLS
ncbi:ATP-binding protein [Filomicrobium sp.]|uniref:ATP-binding protein n=1 Tax=Filomicrobium sp. TaxID=2024831 RepID=UPI0025906B3E|nr:ATP-binding protein [Filomicrobium sp.]MCV0370507.1 ATP-binding protein [Filomicrobium sp.]